MSPSLGLPAWSLQQPAPTSLGARMTSISCQLQWSPGPYLCGTLAGKGRQNWSFLFPTSILSPNKHQEKACWSCFRDAMTPENMLHVSQKMSHFPPSVLIWCPEVPGFPGIYRRNSSYSSCSFHTHCSCQQTLAIWGQPVVVSLTYNKVHWTMCSVLTYFVYPWNCHCDQGSEHLHHPPNFLVPFIAPLFTSCPFPRQPLLCFLFL